MVGDAHYHSMAASNDRIDYIDASAFNDSLATPTSSYIVSCVSGRPVSILFSCPQLHQYLLHQLVPSSLTLALNVSVVTSVMFSVSEFTTVRQANSDPLMVCSLVCIKSFVGKSIIL